jgi:pimeloyl-ACP methyl ester carboxylesterase
MLMVPGRLSVLLKLASPRRYYDPAYLRRVAPQIYGGALRCDPDAIERHAASIEPPRGLGYAYQLAALWGWSSLPWLHRLRLPTLVLAGTEDPIVPLINARILARLLPRARLETFEDGHLFAITGAREVAGRIASFLGEEGEGASA